MAKILIIEDNSKLAGHIGDLLKKEGVDSDIALDGISGLNSFEAGGHDLLLVDIRLPKMDGVSMCRKVRGTPEGKDIPIIMMSGYVTDETTIGKLTRGLRLNGFFVKPFSFKALNESIISSLSEAAESFINSLAAEVSTTAQITAMESEAPAMESEAPAMESEAPAMESEAPAMESEAPAMESEAPAMESEAPAMETGDIEKPAEPVATTEEAVAMEGDLERTPFADLLISIFQRECNGTLHMEGQGRVREFFFLRGVPMDVMVEDIDDSFGGYLLKKGVVAEFEFREYKERRERENGDPRDVFIGMGCLTTRMFREEGREYLISRLVECFSWETGSYSFREYEIGRGLPFADSSDLPNILYKGFMKNLAQETRNSFLERNRGLYISKGSDFYRFQNHFDMEPAALKIMGLINGTRTMAEILNSADVDPEAANTVLFTLDFLKALSYSELPQETELIPPFPIRERVQTAEQGEKEGAVKEEFESLGSELQEISGELGGIQELDMAPQAPVDEGQVRLEEDLKREVERIKNKNYYEIFGMTKNNYSFDNLKTSYFDLIKRYGPEKFFASSSEVMGLAEELLDKVTTAYNTLSNVVSKENYDEIIASQDVTSESSMDEKKFYVMVQFQSGKVFLEKGQYESAEKSFNNCINIFSDQPEYHAYLALALYSNPINKGNPSAVRRVREIVNKSLGMGKLSIAYALRGTILFDEGSYNLAEAEFVKALKLNPNNKTAKKKLDLIKEKREEEQGKGLFQKLFK